MATKAEIEALFAEGALKYSGTNERENLVTALGNLAARDTAVLTGAIPDVSTASSIFFVMPFAGTIRELNTILGGAITAADSVITVKKNGSLVSGFGVTVAYTSSAAGDVDTDVQDVAVAKGDKIEVITNGGSTGAVALGVSLILERE